MGLNYIKEDEKVNEKIILYRKSSKIVEEDDRCKQLQVQENKNPENAYMFSLFYLGINKELLFNFTPFIFRSFPFKKQHQTSILEKTSIEFS